MNRQRNQGLEQIKSLERLYEEATPEIRNRILSRVIEIKTETTCGIMIEIPYIHRRR